MVVSNEKPTAATSSNGPELMAVTASEKLAAASTSENELENTVSSTDTSDSETSSSSDSSSDSDNSKLVEEILKELDISVSLDSSDESDDDDDDDADADDRDVILADKSLNDYIKEHVVFTDDNDAKPTILARSTSEQQASLSSVSKKSAASLKSLATQQSRSSASRKISPSNSYASKVSADPTQTSAISNIHDDGDDKEEDNIITTATSVEKEEDIKSENEQSPEEASISTSTDPEKRSSPDTITTGDVEKEEEAMEDTKPLKLILSNSMPNSPVASPYRSPRQAHSYEDTLPTKEISQLKESEPQLPMEEATPTEEECQPTTESEMSDTEEEEEEEEEEVVVVVEEEEVQSKVVSKTLQPSESDGASESDDTDSTDTQGEDRETTETAMDPTKEKKRMTLKFPKAFRSLIHTKRLPNAKDDIIVPKPSSQKKPRMLRSLFFKKTGSPAIAPASVPKDRKDFVDEADAKVSYMPIDSDEEATEAAQNESEEKTHTNNNSTGEIDNSAEKAREEDNRDDDIEKAEEIVKVNEEDKDREAALEDSDARNETSSITELLSIRKELRVKSMSEDMSCTSYSATSMNSDTEATTDTGPENVTEGQNFLNFAQQCSAFMWWPITLGTSNNQEKTFAEEASDPVKSEETEEVKAATSFFESADKETIEKPLLESTGYSKMDSPKALNSRDASARDEGMVDHVMTENTVPQSRDTALTSDQTLEEKDPEIESATDKQEDNRDKEVKETKIRRKNFLGWTVRKLRRQKHKTSGGVEKVTPCREIPAKKDFNWLRGKFSKKKEVYAQSVQDEAGPEGQHDWSVEIIGDVEMKYENGDSAGRKSSMTPESPPHRRDIPTNKDEIYGKKAELLVEGATSEIAEETTAGEVPAEKGTETTLADYLKVKSAVSSEQEGIEAENEKQSKTCLTCDINTCQEMSDAVMIAIASLSPRTALANAKKEAVSLVGHKNTKNGSSRFSFGYRLGAPMDGTNINESSNNDRVASVEETQSNTASETDADTEETASTSSTASNVLSCVKEADKTGALGSLPTFHSSAETGDSPRVSSESPEKAKETNDSDTPENVEVESPKEDVSTTSEEREASETIAPSQDVDEPSVEVKLDNSESPETPLSATNITERRTSGLTFMSFLPDFNWSKKQSVEEKKKAIAKRDDITAKPEDTAKAEDRNDINTSEAIEASIEEENDGIGVSVRLAPEEDAQLLQHRQSRFTFTPQTKDEPFDHEQILDFLERKSTAYWIETMDEGSKTSDYQSQVASTVASDDLTESEIVSKIESSLKKTEFIANRFGEDLDQLLRQTSTSDSVRQERDDLAIVGQKIDASLSKLERLAHRLGVDIEDMDCE